MKEFTDSDERLRADRIGMSEPHIAKRGECFVPTGDKVHDFDEAVVLATFKITEKGMWRGRYAISGGTCIRDSDMWRINPPPSSRKKSEPSIRLKLRTPLGIVDADFCCVVTLAGKLLAHKKTGTLYKLTGECMGSSHMWIVKP